MRSPLIGSPPGTCLRIPSSVRSADRGERKGASPFARLVPRAAHRRIGTLEDDDLVEGDALSPIHETECAVRSRIHIKTA